MYHVKRLTERLMKTWVSWIKPDKSAPIDINAINSNFDLQIFRQLIKAMPTIILLYYNIRVSHAKLESVAQIHCLNYADYG